ncbi:hypothetical protein KM043_002348 [Ampulex compressa]|nr:hypothetical protein KM043_002348 [Ampulex compressa]
MFVQVSRRAGLSLTTLFGPPLIRTRTINRWKRSQECLDILGNGNPEMDRDSRMRVTPGLYDDGRMLLERVITSACPLVLMKKHRRLPGWQGNPAIRAEMNVDVSFTPIGDRACALRVQEFNTELWYFYMYVRLCGSD